MNIKRFFGKNSREALSMVRNELGDNAIILTNRAVNGGNEIMAFTEEDMNIMVNKNTANSNAVHDDFVQNKAIKNTVVNQHAMNQRPAMPQKQPHPQNDPPTLLALLNNNPASIYSKQAEPRESKLHSSTPSPIRSQSNPPVVTKEKVIPNNGNINTNAARQTETNKATAGQLNPSQQMAEMLKEMRNMRSVIESQLTTISWGNIQQRDPVKSSILSSLLAAGFSASLARQLAEKLPEHMNLNQATEWIKAILARNLNTVENETEVLDRGGVFALVGPTGVGKTTTTAKLAARYVMKHGTQNLGLITTDAYRIGGHEQLRIYGKILGVMVHAVKDEADLKIALHELRGKHTILIDTVGVSQRDRMVAEQIAMFSNTNTPIKKLLCLNATNTGETLTDVIKAYKGNGLHGKGIDGCIITKLDEAVTIGSALDVAIREKLKLFYATNGQRVPEDIHLANKQQLIQHAFKLSTHRNPSFQYLNEELPFIMGNTVQAANSNRLSEISYG